MQNEAPQKVVQFPSANRAGECAKQAASANLDDEIESAKIAVIDAMLARHAKRLKALQFEDAEIVLAELDLALLRAERSAN